MKLIIYWSILLLLILSQIVIGDSFGLIFAVPLSLIGIIVFAGFISTEQILYMAFFSGLILDLASGKDFGLNLSYMIFVALLCKLVIHLGQREQNWLNIMILSALLVMLYNFLLIILVYSNEQLDQITGYVSQLAWSVGISLVWTLLLYSLVLKLSKSEISFKFVRNTNYLQRLNRNKKS